MRWRATIAALGLVLAGCTPTVDGHGTRAATCPAVFFGVAGSGEGMQNPARAGRPPGVAAADARRYGTTIALLKTELVERAGRGLARAAAIDYPAAPVSTYIDAGGLNGELDASERKGVTRLVAAIRAAYRGDCAGRPVLLAGYSQGAEVVVRAVTALSRDERRSVAVALFGNPSYRPGLAGDHPGGTEAAGIRPTFQQQAYTLPADVRPRTIDICAPGDPICGIDPRQTTFLGRLAWVLDHMDVHSTAYTSSSTGYAETAARFLWTHRTG